MRNIFIKKIIERARINKNLYLLTGDLGYNSFEPFINEFPDRFINVGVAENNMVGISAGLALSKKDVCVYSIIPFLVFRSLEQIRNNICHNNLNVKLIGGGGGFSYGEQGISHNTTEDLGIMRCLPQIKVLTPGTKLETELVIDKMFETKGPFFIRLGKVPEKEFHKNNIKYELGDGLIVKNGNDLTLICCGNIIENVMIVASKLDDMNISTKVISYPCIKPINEKFLVESINLHSKIVVIEEHSTIGGLGSAINDILINHKFNNFKIKKIALSDTSHKQIGNQKYLRDINNLGIETMKKSILEFNNE